LSAYFIAAVLPEAKASQASCTGRNLGRRLAARSVRVPPVAHIPSLTRLKRRFVKRDDSLSAYFIAAVLPSGKSQQ